MSGIDPKLEEIKKAWGKPNVLFAEFQERLLEPRTVSKWLGLPGAQLPRETAKIIGQPSQPARKKGSSAGYSVKDAILMKLGRTFTEMGITPHRVRACVEKVREVYGTVLWGYRPYGPDESEMSYYIVGRETSSGFKVVFVKATELQLVITERGLESVSQKEAFHGTAQGHLESEIRKRPEVNLSTIPPTGLDELDREEAMEQLAEQGFGDQVDPGSPAIVQNVTRYLRDQSMQLFRFLEKAESRTKA